MEKLTGYFYKAEVKRNYAKMFALQKSIFLYSIKHCVAFPKNYDPLRGGMNFRRFDNGYPHEDYLDAEARAVIDADFEEIHPIHPRKNFIAQLREGWVWIKHRLLKA